MGFVLIQIKTALISVYNKEGLLPILEELKKLNVHIITTGGTYEFITGKGFEATKVEKITGFASIFGGRVKTLHPRIFGGILGRRENEKDIKEKEKHNIDFIDLVIVDLYPFAEVVQSSAEEDEIIENIDVGGVSLIRAAAKNFKDVLVVPSKDQYAFLLDILTMKDGCSELNDRRLMANQAFSITSNYDTNIYHYFSKDTNEALKQSFGTSIKLRYGENPHQEGYYHGDLNDAFFQHHGKQLSYNNLLDIDSAIRLINDLDRNTISIIKHLNPCGVACRQDLLKAWKDALAADPVSAYGGIIATASIIDKEIAEEINKIFFEIILASGYSFDALEILKSKKNRIILQLNNEKLPLEEVRTALFGLLVQERDIKVETEADFNVITQLKPDQRQIEDLIFANGIVKNVKSNAIVIVKDKQMIGVGMGQSSRIDALNQAINKAKNFHFDLKDAVLASDAFFPFYDSVKTAYEAGITAVIQPGGSIRDQESIDFCNEQNMVMIFTGTRHFKH
jgi:phosphoribosylaminoimidazolecarboxamide formyltransferase / IMP cyclohydrolase